MITKFARLEFELLTSQFGSGFGRSGKGSTAFCFFEFLFCRREPITVNRQLLHILSICFYVNYVYDVTWTVTSTSTFTQVIDAFWLFMVLCIDIKRHYCYKLKIDAKKGETA
jgi:hypothetical protein